MRRQEQARRHIGIDQYGHTYWLGRHPRKELLEQLGRMHADKMYRDDTSTQGHHHAGYVIGGLWIDVFRVEPIGGLAA